MIGRGRTHCGEEGAAIAVRRQIACVGKSVLARKFGETLQIIAKAFEFGIDDRVGAISGDHPTAPFAAFIRGADGGVMLERVERAFGRRDHLDPERSEEHTSELQALMRNTYAVFCLKNTNTIK